MVIFPNNSINFTGLIPALDGGNEGQFCPFLEKVFSVIKVLTHCWAGRIFLLQK